MKRCEANVRLINFNVCRENAFRMKVCAMELPIAKISLTKQLIFVYLRVARNSGFDAVCEPIKHICFINDFFFAIGIIRF